MSAIRKRLKTSLLISIVFVVFVTGCVQQEQSVRTLTVQPRQSLNIDTITNLWNSLQSEMSLDIRVIQSSIKNINSPSDHVRMYQAQMSASHVQLSARTGTNHNAIERLELYANPQSEHEVLSTISAYSLLLALIVVPQSSLESAMSEATKTLHVMGVKPDINALELQQLAQKSVQTVFKDSTVTLNTSPKGYVFSIQLPNASSVKIKSIGMKRTNLSYLYFGNPASYVQQIDKTNNTITTVAPSYFDLMDEGQLDITWKLDRAFITEMKRRNIKVVPFLSNHWNRQYGIDALNRSDPLTDEITSAVTTYQLDGVNVDIEGVGATYRDAFSQFVRKLRAKLPSEKELSVAVAANPNGWRTGWHGFYDYRALASVADYLMVMAYDESWEGSEPGPVSSLSFFQRSLEFALNEGVTREKIVMGVPFYGRLWKMNSGNVTDNGTLIRGLGVSNSRVQGLLDAYNGQTFYDDTKQSPYAIFDIPEGGGSYIAGKWCDSGQYILWYENEQSLKQKLRLLARYGVRGAGSWSLYQEAPGTWNYFADWLNGRVFRDVSLGYWAEADIFRAADRGWMEGVSSELFAPNQALTRAQAVATLTRFLKVDVSPNIGSPTFTDVPTTHWAYPAIEAAYQRGMIQGVRTDVSGGRLFLPNERLTREQLATLLARTLVLPIDVTEPLPFRDVPTNRWSHDAIEVLYRNGIMSGVDLLTFGTALSTSRAQMAAIVNRLPTNSK